MNRPGFSLVETIVGMTVIAIALYLLIAIFISLLPRIARIETIDKKAYLANEKMEEFLARTYTQVATVEPAAFTSTGFSQYRYRIIVSRLNSNLAVTAEASAKFKKVQVQVWGGPVDIVGTVELTSLVPNL